MKISITMISFKDRIEAEGLTAEAFIDLCAGLGVDAVDLLEYYWQDKANEVRRIPEVLKDKGLALGAFCIGNNFMAPAAFRPGMIDTVKSGIDTAVQLGAERLRIFGGSAGIAEEMWADRLNIVADSISECVAYAKAGGVTMILENHGGVPLTSDEMLSIIQKVDSPWLKLNFDMGNFLGCADEDPLSAAEKTLRYVEFIHVKDLAETNGMPPYRACPLGEGVVPVKDCLRYFKNNGYKGYVSLEYEAWSSLNAMEGVKAGLVFLRKTLACI
jgi:sugar phosphate isomerase/epimerase